jgi:hypothetical protein
VLPRIIAIVVIAFVGLSLFSAYKRAQRAREQRRNTFRPQKPAEKPTEKSADNAAPKRAQSGSSDETMVSLISRSDAKYLRDALTGKPILENGQERVWQCAKCQSLYFQSSIDALTRDAAGQCVQCQSTDRHLTVFTD